MKTKRERIWKISHTLLERQALSFSSYKHRELEVRLRWVGTRERRKRAFFVSLILPGGTFFDICALFQCLVHWINFHNTYTFTYQKHYFLCSFTCFWNRKKPSVYPYSRKFVAKLHLKSHDLLIMCFSKITNKLKSLYRYHHSLHGQQTWQDEDLILGAPTYNIRWDLSHVVLWDHLGN